MVFFEIEINEKRSNARTVLFQSLAKVKMLECIEERSTEYCMKILREI